MSVQIFLQGKLLGIDEFLTAGRGGASVPAEDPRLLEGRSLWVTLLSEVLPRALLAELGLSRILLGSSGGGQFLVVLPREARPQAEEFLARARDSAAALSGGQVKFVWAVTENLGDWAIVRKRLNEDMQRQRRLAEAPSGPEFFRPYPEDGSSGGDCAYFEQLGRSLREAQTAGWNPEDPARVLTGEGKHTWSLTSPADGIPIARHAAPAGDAKSPAGIDELRRRAEGRPGWGVLRGDVDSFGIRIRRAQTIEEHVQLSVMYKGFFAGELEVLCSMPDFWRKVTVLYSGGDDFAVYGAWDALIALAREMQRMFHRFSEENLKDFPGPEGRTITMALALAPEAATPLAQVFQDAGRKLEIAKSGSKDCFHLLGRTLEWKQVGSAAEIRDTMARLVLEFDCPPRLLGELAAFYRESQRPAGGAAPARGRENIFEKPWRLHRRVNRALGGARDRELQRLRASLLSDLLGKSAAQWKLRPAGRVALEWARLSTEV